jgi:hypothetical protein
MARRTIELKSSASTKLQTDVLVYKDADGSDAEMASGDESGASDDDEDESEEEEIIEIPLDKRRIVDESDDYGDQIDDSVSSSGESDSMVGDSAEEGEIMDYNSENDAVDQDLASSNGSMVSGDDDMDSEDLIK